MAQMMWPMRLGLWLQLLVLPVGLILPVHVGLPIWILIVGALGIAAGLMLFGPKLVRTVGEKITKLDRARAYCVALSAAITVIIASTFGLPVSSTHIAVGGVYPLGIFQ